MQCERRAQDTLSVIVEFEAERLGESAGPSRDQFVPGVRGKSAKVPHMHESLERFGGSKQNGARASRKAADDVHAGVNSVTSIAVQASGWAEHRPIASCRPAVSVRCGVAAVAEISLDLDQANDQSFARRESSNESTADEFRCDQSRVARIEGLTKGCSERHARIIGKTLNHAPSRPAETASES